MKNKVKWLCALLACLLIGTTAAACGNDDHPEYSFPEYGYTNPGETAVDIDEEVTLDGNLDESFWSEKRWFESYLESSPQVTLRVTSHFGEKGVYFAFDVNDPEVYAVPERFTWYNSAVELYVSTADGANNLANGDAYEADVDASGRTSIRKWSRQGVGAYGFNNWPTEMYGEAVTKNGAVNTAECTGYTVEMFIPWEGLGGERQEFLYVNPTLIRTSSANPVDQDRIWYNFGMEERGAAWGSAGTWWVFDENGLDALDVTTSVSGAGSLNARSYVVAGDDYTFMIEPEAGNYLKSLVIDGVDVTDNIRHNYAAGMASYTATNVSDALSIEAEFTPFAASRTVTGTVTADVPLPNNNFALSRLYAVKNGSITAIPVAADGTFTAQLPAEEMQLIVTADGYYVSAAEVAADAATATIALTASDFGNNENVGFEGYSAANWDFSRYMTEGVIASANTEVHNRVLKSDVFGTDVLISGRITLPQANRDVRSGFTFFNAAGEAVYFAILWDVESRSYVYTMQTITWYDGNDHWENTGASVPVGACYEMLRNDGMPFAVHFKDGTFTVWLNGTEVLSDYTVVKSGNVNMFADASAAVGLETWACTGEFRDITVTTNASGYPSAVIEPHTLITGAGEVSFDKETYTAGDTVSMTFAPGEGTQLSALYINGIDYFGLVADNALTLTAFAGPFLNVRAEFMRVTTGTAAYTGTVSGYKDGETNILEGAEVRLKDADAFDRIVNVGADGTFSFADVPFGNYVLTVNMPGYSEYSEKVSFSGDMTSDVTLAWDFANIVSGSADLSGMNEANHAIGINTWGSMVQLTLDDGTAAGDTVAVKVNIRANRATGNWGDNFGVILAEKDGTYYGLSFLFENLSNPSGNAQLKQQWTDTTVNAYMPAWVGEAIIGGGLDTLFVRNGTIIDVFASHNGVWTYLGSTSVPGDAVTDVRFQQWGDSVYSGIEWTGDISIDPTVTTGENGDATFSPVSYGEDLAITLTPDEGYMIGSVTINGVPFDELEGVSVADNVLTLADWRIVGTVIDVAFVPEVTADAEIAVTLIKGADSAAIADGTEVRLVGLNEYVTEAADGKVTFSDILTGTYTLVIEGYETAVVTVSGEAIDPVTLAYDWVRLTTDVDNNITSGTTADVNLNSAEASVSWTDSVSDMIWLNVEDSENFSFEATAHYPNLTAGTITRFMLFAMRFNGNGANGIISFELETQNNQFQLFRHWVWGYDQGFRGVNSTAAQINALRDGTFRYRVIREGDLLSIYVYDGTVWSAVHTDLSLNATYGESGTAYIGVGQQWVGVSSISDIAYTTEDITAVNVEETPAAGGSYTVSAGSIGEAVTITATPEAGYYVERITVTGTDYTEFTGDGDVKTLTIDSFDSPWAFVTVRFTPIQYADVSFAVTGLKGSAGGTIADGTAYTLTGAVTIEGTVTGGRVVEENVRYGTYTLTVEGYLPTTITVGETAVSDVTLRYNWVGLVTNSDNIDKGSMDAVWADDGSPDVSWTTSVNEMLWLREADMSADTSFSYEAVLSWPGYSAGSGARYTPFAIRFGSEKNNIVAIDIESEGAARMQLYRRWDSWPYATYLTEDETTALRNGTLRFRVVRDSATLYVYLGTGLTDTSWRLLITGDLSPWGDVTGMIGIGQLWVGACSVSDIAFDTSDSYKDIAITEVPAENGECTVTGGAIGDDLVVTATPVDGYFVEKITVNGTDYRTFTDGADGAKVLTLSSYTAAPEVTVSVTFTEIELGDVDITLYGHYGTDTTLFAEGTAYTLTGPAQQSGQVAAGGKVTLEGIQAGTYALTVEGYEPYTFELTADGYTNEVTLEYDWVRYATDADSTVIDGTTAVVDMNSDNPTVSWSGTANEVLWLNFEDSETFSFEATVHYTGYTANQRLMLFAMRFDATILSFELATDSNNFQFFKHWDWDWQPGHGFIGYAATQEQMDALEAGTFRYRVVRSGDTIRIYIYDGANWSKRFDAGLSYTYGLSGAADIGFGTYNSGAVAFSGISYDASDSYNDLVVTEAPAENGEYTVTENGIGGDLVVTATPSSGYYVESITLNGIQYTGEQLTDGDGSDKVLTVSGYDELPEISVSVSFAAIVEVSINTAEVYGYRDGEHTLIPAGTPYTLTGPVSREGTLPAEGTLVEEGLIAGQYTLTIGDYFLPDGLNLQVPEFSTALVLWYDYAEELTGADFIDTAGMNDADHAIVFTDYGLLRLNIGDLADDKTVYVKTTIKVNEVAGGWSDNFGVVMAATDDTESGRYGLSFLYGDLNNPSQDSYIKQQWAGQQDAAAGLPDWVATSLLGDGLEVMYVRNTTVIDLFAFDGTTWTKLASYTGIPEAATTDIIFGQWGASTYFNTEFSGDLSVDVNIGTFENGAVTANSPAYGGTLELTVAPEEGYALDTLTVNGIAYTELVASYGASFDGTVLSVPGWSNLYAEVSATFKETAATDVSFSLELHKYGIDDDNRIAIPDGTTVTLTGPNQYVLQAADGGISQAGMTNGEYTVSVDGYRTLTINVGGDALESSYTLEYDAVDQTRSAAVYDISAINDGTILLDTDNNRDVVYLNETVAAGEDFMITAVFKNPNLSAAEIRYGFIAAHDANGDGSYSVDGNGNTATAEMVMPNILYQNSTWSLQFCDTWQGVAFDSTMSTKFSGDGITAAEGLTVGFARIGGRYYMYADNGGERLARWVSNSVYSSGLADGALQLGFRSWQAGTGCEQYEILRGDAVSRALYPAGVYDVTDAWRTPKNWVDADVTWTEEEKSVVFNGATGEYVWLDLAPSDTFTFTANVTVTGYPSGDVRVTPFALLLGPENNEIVAFDINQLNVQLYKRWDFNDFIGVAMPAELYAADGSGGTYTINMALKAEFSDGTLTISIGTSQDTLQVIAEKSSFSGVTLHDNMRIGVGQNNVCAFSVTDITYTTTVA